MKLYYSGASPFARKVIVAAHELGLADQIELVTVTVSPTGTNETVSAANPLAKIPTLLLGDGTALYDSRVIVDYLDTLGSRTLAPQSGTARFRVLTEAAAADGLAEAALLARYEEFLRPEPLRWADWTAGQLAKAARALDLFEAQPRRAGDDLTIADIAVACGLGYLDLRFPDLAWRDGRPKLAAFYAEIGKRPSMTLTEPK